MIPATNGPGNRPAEERPCRPRLLGFDQVVHPGGQRLFLANFVGPWGQERAYLTATHLLDYKVFQHAVLEDTGLLFRHGPAELPGKEGADGWFDYLQEMLAVDCREQCPANCRPPDPERN
jgi:hypothetical protein